MAKSPSLFMEALQFDNSLPIEKQAVELWLKDLQNPLRWTVRPVLQFFLVMLLHLVWFFKRLPFPQFRNHTLLQSLICWFCRHFVSVEANKLILRHYATESNVLNFLADNSPGHSTTRVALYPQSIDQMIANSFVDHDQELFRMMKELGHWQHRDQPISESELSWEHWRPVDIDQFHIQKRRTQVIDFETAHALFMCLFCFLLTRDEYRDAINGFNFDQSIALRISQMIGDPAVVEMAYNKYPLYIVSPWKLGQRFLMHGFFTEYMYARLETIRTSSAERDKPSEEPAD